MTALKTPLRYPGGKSRAAPYIFADNHLPKQQPKTYVEPFLGGGSCALYFSQKYPDTKIFVSDDYANLVCFWKTLQSRGPDLIKHLLKQKQKAMDYVDQDTAHRELFFSCKESINSKAVDEFGKAWRFFVINKCSFSGLGELSGFSASASKQNFSVSCIEKLTGYVPVIANWEISLLPFQESIKRFMDSPDTLLYADPPYHIDGTIYTRNKENKWSEQDSIDLFELFSDTRCNTLVSYNSCEWIKNLYKGWKQIDWSLTYTLHSGKNYRSDEKNRMEILMMNYEPYENALQEAILKKYSGS